MPLNGTTASQPFLFRPPSPWTPSSDESPPIADVFGDIQGEERKAVDLAVVAAERLQDRIRVRALPTAAAVPLGRSFVSDVRLSGLVNADGNLEMSVPSKSGDASRIVRPTTWREPTTRAKASLTATYRKSGSRITAIWRLGPAKSTLEDASISRARLLRVPPRNPLGQTVDSHMV